MSREGLLMLFGILVLLSPFFGLPYSFLMWLLPALGILIAAIAFSLRARRTKESSIVSTHDQSVA